MSISLFEAITTEDATTANGALTHSTSQNPVLDLFFLAGAARSISEEDILRLIQKAYLHNPLQTLKLIFWSGDCRQGIGERRFFKIALKFLDKHYPEVLGKNLGLVPFFSRWDSLFDLEHPEVLNLVKAALDNKDSLLAKWLPRQHSKKFVTFRKAFQAKFNLNDRDYRKLIVGLSNTVEQLMTAKKWDQIIYRSVPSVAMNKYRTAFYKHDEARFAEFIEKVTSGEEKINAGAIFPHDLYRSLVKTDKKQEHIAIDAQWNALPNYLAGSEEKFLPVVDCSGSMDMANGLPAAIAISLGIYLSERNESIFKDGFITFSTSPKLQTLKGSFSEKVRQFDRSFALNTDLQKVFQVVLEKAKAGNVSQEQMPTSIILISDMEFDSCCDGRTNFDNIRDLYAQSGYALPNIIFWNVSGTPGNVPVKMNQQGVALISGASPSIIKAVLGGDVSPMRVMETTLNGERYKEVQL